MKVPCSPYEKAGGLYYFKRMVEKIRLHKAGELRDDLVENLGSGFDGRCTQFLRVSYEDLVAKVGEGLSDDDLLEWCYSTGRRLDENDITIFNGFLRKVGWKDQVTARLVQRKAESGLWDREDIQTIFDYLDADEGRPTTLEY